MLRYALRRLKLVVPVIVLIMVCTFLLVEMVPGDAADVIAGEQAGLDPEVIRENLGLNEPFLERFVTYMGNAARGDFGESMVVALNRSVWELVKLAAPITLSLALLTMVIVAVVGITAGVAAGLRPRSWIDRLVTLTASLSLSIPAFVIGLLFVTVFAIELDLLPATGYAKVSEGWWEWLSHLILPAVTLAIAPAAEVARQVRGSLMDTMEQEFIRTARAKGLSERRTIIKHAGKACGLPLVTIYGLQVNRVIAGTVLIERIFGLSGIGSLAVDATLRRDFPVVQAVVLFTSVWVVASNYLVDVSYAYFQPQLRRTP